MPGTASGTQAVEAMHAYWQKLTQLYGRIHILAILERMQVAFKDHWDDYFHWTQTDTTCLRSAAHDMTLYNGAALRSNQRSPARDFWAHREEGNYQHIRRRTGTEAADALSDFYVMRAEGPDNRRLPATTQVPQGTATDIVNCILAPPGLMQTTLLHAGIFKRDTPDGPVEVVASRLHHLFHSHCVVITGHLAQEYWPLFYKSTGAARFSTLCTCTCYGLRAECEHSIFVEALTR